MFLLENPLLKIETPGITFFEDGGFNYMRVIFKMFLKQLSNQMNTCVMRKKIEQYNDCFLCGWFNIRLV